MTASTFAIGGIAYWMPYYIIEYRKGGTEGVVDSIFGGILVVAGLTATLAGGWLGDKLRGRYPGSYFLVSGSGMILGFPMLLACMYTPFPLAWVWIFFTIFFLFLNTGPANTILANVTHPAIRATGFALNILLIHALGDAISPTIIGAITDLTGGDMNAGFLFVSGMFVVSGLLWLAGSRFLERDTELAPTRLEEGHG
jgi:MFS family permease